MFRDCNILMAKNNANARIRREIAQILFEEGAMTRARMSSILHERGNYRSLPSDSSLTSLLAKNSQIVQVGTEKVDMGDGVKNKNIVYDIDREMIRSEEDLIYSRPYSSMSESEKKRATHCPSCRQKRLMKDRYDECLVCARKGLY